VRYLLSYTYRPDPELRDRGCRAIAMAAKYHPRLIKGIVERLLWAMSDDAGANVANAPEVLSAIAEASPELLRNKVFDLIKLAKTEAFNEGLSETLRILAKHYPGEVSGRLSRALNTRITEGENGL